MPLESVLSVAALTPGQACLVAAQLLQAAQRLGEADDPPSPGAGLGPVALTACGTLDVGRPGGRPGTGVDELLGQVLRNARRLPTHPKPEQLALLHRLEDAAAASSLEADVRAYMLRTAVAETLGAGAGERLTGQLGELAEACARLAGAARPAVPDAPRKVDPASVAGPVPAGAPGAAGSPRPSPRRSASARPAPRRPSRPGRARLHRRFSRRRTALVALVVLLMVAALAGYAVLRGTGGDVMGALGLGGGTAAPAASPAAHPSTQSAGHSRSPAGQAGALAPRHAGTITGVVLRRTGACRPGAPCPVKVSVHLRPSRTSRSVSWKVGAARLCRRGLSWSPPKTVTVRPRGTSVHASTVARVPRGRALALVALTTAPARAQSRPVPVTGSSLRC